MEYLYLFLVVRGLEELVLREIYEKLDVISVAICTIQQDAINHNLNFTQGEAAVGRILLKTSSNEIAIQSIQSVQAKLAFLIQSDAISIKDSKSPEEIGKIIANADWTNALQLWHNHIGQYRPEAERKFRASCVRSGAHSYKSYEIAGEIGAEVIEKYHWKVDLTHFDLEIVCILQHNYMIAGISLEDPEKIKFGSRLANEDRASIIKDSKYASTLRPSTAYLLYTIANIEPGVILLDAMCGVGTIPICCASFAKNQIFALGGEIDHLPCTKANENAKDAGRMRGNIVNICQWDATKLPVRTNSIDKIIIDMPFGIRCGNFRMNQRMYPKILKELYRVLRTLGRAVLLTISKKLFLQSIKSLKFKILQSWQVNIGGFQAYIYLLERLD